LFIRNHLLKKNKKKKVNFFLHLNTNQKKMASETKEAEFVNVNLETTEIAVASKTPIEAQIEVLQACEKRFLVAMTESEELSILREFGNSFHEVNHLIKQIPQQEVRGDQTTTTFIAESKTEIQKYTKILTAVKAQFEKIVREKWQSRVKYPIDWTEPDAWYALITLAMSHVSAETRLVWDKISDASVKLDSLTTEVSSILDSILSLFGIKKTNSKTFTRTEDEIKLDEQRVTSGGAVGSTVVTLPALKIPQTFFQSAINGVSSTVGAPGSKKRKWIIIVLCFVVFSIAVISWFSRQYGGVDYYESDDMANLEDSSMLNDTLTFNSTEF
jgi:hypothetical protein